jgi:hypothetical protein
LFRKECYPISVNELFIFLRLIMNRNIIS